MAAVVMAVILFIDGDHGGAVIEASGVINCS
jgi:hypothetical protein